MKAIAARNLELLHSVDPESAALLRRTAPAEQVSLGTSRNGLEVLVARHGERERWLHSRVDPTREAGRLTEMLPGHTGTVVVFGLGAGHHIRALLQRPDVRRIFICEPVAAYAARALEVAGTGELFTDPRVRLLTPCTADRLAWTLGTGHAPLLHGDAAFLPLRGRTDLAPSLFGELQQAAQRGIQQALSDFATQRRFGLRWMHNILVNAATLRRAHTEVFGPIAGSCAVTAAGPSLERFLSRPVPEGTTLIATDTSLPMLLQRGAPPRFVLSIDSQLASYHHFLSGIPSGSVLVADLTASPTALRQAATTALRVGGHPLARYLCDHWVRVPALYTFAGSVTHAAIAFARSELGADTVGLLGADFAYPGAAAYARDSYIHRHVRLHESRIAPAEHAFSAFVYDRARPAQEGADRGDLRYESPLLNGYRQQLGGLTDELGITIQHGSVPPAAFAAGGPSIQDRREESARRTGPPRDPRRLPSPGPALQRYLEALRALPDPPEGWSLDMDSLPAEEATIWHTILPIAAAESAVDMTTGRPTSPPAEALDRARRRALEFTREVVKRIYSSRE